MNELNRHAGFDRPSVTGRAELRGDLGKEGTEPLPPGQKEVLGHFGEERIIGRGGLGQPLFDDRQTVPDAGDGDQVCDVGWFHCHVRMRG